MRRPAKGATTHPPVSRPGHGYGRPVRPRPDRSPSHRPWLDPQWWVTGEPADAEASAPGRPSAVAEA